MQFHCLFMMSCMRSLQYPSYPVIIISKVIYISCNGRRSGLLNNYIIDKFIDTISDFVCTRIVVGH